MNRGVVAAIGLRFAVLCLLLLALAACGSNDDARIFANETPTRRGDFYKRPAFQEENVVGTLTYIRNPRLAEKLQTSAITRNAVHINQLIVTKMRINDEMVSLSNLSPRVINAIGPPNDRALTAARFSDDGLELMLFSRDPLTGVGYRMLIPSSKLHEEPKTVAFPVLFADGSFRKASITIFPLRHRRPPNDPLERFQSNRYVLSSARP